MNLGLLACMAVLVAAHLGSAPASPSHSYSVHDSAQRQDTLVRIAGLPRFGSATLVPELTIGRNESRTEYSFSAIGDLAEGPDGSIYVLDRARPSMVKKFNSAGSFLYNLGRTGDGPGEYRTPAGIAVLPDGSVAVIDASDRRVNLYSSTGSSTGSWSVGNYRMAVGVSGFLRSDASGILYLRTGPIGAAAAASQTGLVVRYSASGQLIDTMVVELPSPTRASAPVSARAGTPQPILAGTPYDHRTFWTVSGAGFVVTGVGSKYSFEILAPASPPGANTGAMPGSARQRMWRPGDPVLSVRREIAPVEVSSEERRDLRTAIDRRANAPGGTAGPGEIPRYKPAYRGLLAGTDGSIWVDVFEKSKPISGPVFAAPVERQSGWSSPIVFDVFERDGTYLGRVQFPDNAYPVIASTSRVWAHVIDADNVPSISRFRIVWGTAR